MCFSSKSRAPQPQPIPIQPTMSRTNVGLEADPLPSAKKEVDPDDVASVEYGTARKKQSPALGKKKGAAALKVPLAGGTGTGGSPTV